MKGTQSPFEFSQFTRNRKILFEQDDAVRYLYCNGAIDDNVNQKAFMSHMSKTTICAHIRLLHALTWFLDPYVFKYILYCITDSKTVVGYLRQAKNDPDFDRNWWHQQSINAFSKDDINDDFWNSKIPFKCKSIAQEDIASSFNLINSSDRYLPDVFLAYKTMYTMIDSSPVFNDDVKRESCLIILESVSLRMKLENRVLYWESNIK